VDLQFGKNIEASIWLAVDVISRLTFVKGASMWAHTLRVSYRWRFKLHIRYTILEDVWLIVLLTVG
jgi:hypothetical protein